MSVRTPIRRRGSTRRLGHRAWAEAAHERVADALRRRRKTHVPLTDDEQRPLFTDASDEADVPSLGGRLVVPEDAEL